LQSALTPAAKAIETWDSSSFEIDNSAATRPDEQAVSTVILGPVRPRTKDKRFATIDATIPVPEKAEALQVRVLRRVLPHPIKAFIVTKIICFL
jgi:hypothetical protein